MDNDIKIRLAKLKELAERGATEGERNAARKGMQRIIDKYNLTDINIDWDGLFKYRFKYKSKIEMYLIIQVSRVLAGIEEGKWYQSWDQEIVIELKYLDYITIECAYEYFRRHMNSQWRKSALPELKKCRKAKTRNKKRELLQQVFFATYCKKSGLYRAEDFEKAKRTQSDRKSINKMGGIEGGKYREQVSNGLYLEASK